MATVSIPVNHWLVKDVKEKLKDGSITRVVVMTGWLDRAPSINAQDALYLLEGIAPDSDMRIAVYLCGSIMTIANTD